MSDFPPYQLHGGSWAGLVTKRQGKQDDFRESNSFLSRRRLGYTRQVGISSQDGTNVGGKAKGQELKKHSDNLGRSGAQKE